MDYQEILQKHLRYQALLAAGHISPVTLQSYEQSFEIQFIHDSTAIEGNTLTLMETKVLLEDGISIGGKSLREIYEAVNHQKAYQYVKDRIQKELPLDEAAVKDIHDLLMQNIFPGGIYRNTDVYISGAQHTPPSPNEMYRQIKDFYADLSWKSSVLNRIELAAWTHAEFVRIHPFPDGNGRTSRLLMNYQLMHHGFPPVSIAKAQRLEYFNTLEHYALTQDLAPFSDMLAGLVSLQLDLYLSMREPELEVSSSVLDLRIADATARAAELNARHDADRSVPKHQAPEHE